MTTAGEATDSHGDYSEPQDRQHTGSTGPEIGLELMGQIHLGECLRPATFLERTVRRWENGSKKRNSHPVMPQLALISEAAKIPAARSFLSLVSHDMAVP